MCRDDAHTLHPQKYKRDKLKNVTQQINYSEL